jgi:hypothetical protein
LHPTDRNLEKKTVTFRNFYYIEYVEKDKDWVVSQHTLANYPKELQNKVDAIKILTRYLGHKITSPIKENDKMSNQSDFVYIKQWLSTKYGMMFRLSNHTVQVGF